MNLTLDLVMDTPIFCILCCLYVLFSIGKEKINNKSNHYFKIIVIFTMLFIAFDCAYTILEITPGSLTYDRGFWLDYFYNLFSMMVAIAWYFYSINSVKKIPRGIVLLTETDFVINGFFALLMPITKNRHWFVEMQGEYLDTLPLGMAWAAAMTVPIIIVFIIAIHNYRDKSCYAYREQITPLLVYPVILIVTCVYKIIYSDSFLLMIGMTISVIYLYTITRRGYIYSDELTGLENRRKLNKEIEQFNVGNVPWGMTIIDVNSFKGINDRFGHSTGDDALRDTAKALQETALRYEAKAYRVGGDEFVVLKKNTTEEELDNICKEANRYLKGFLHENNKRYELEISYGISISNERKTIPELISLADERLYEMKRTKGNKA